MCRGYGAACCYIYSDPHPPPSGRGAMLDTSVSGTRSDLLRGFPEQSILVSRPYSVHDVWHDAINKTIRMITARIDHFPRQRSIKCQRDLKGVGLTGGRPNLNVFISACEVGEHDNSSTIGVTQLVGSRSVGTYRHIEQRRSTVAACVPAIYGMNMDPTHHKIGRLDPLGQLETFMATHRALGVDHFFLYACDAASVNHSSVRRSDTTVLFTPFCNREQARMIQRGQPFTINDCIHRAAAQRFSWVVSMDIDERLSVGSDLDLHDLLDGNLARSADVMTIQNVQVWRSRNGSIALQEGRCNSTGFEYVDPKCGKQGYRVKTKHIARPHRVFAANIHFIDDGIPGSPFYRRCRDGARDIPCSIVHLNLSTLKILEENGLYGDPKKSSIWPVLRIMPAVPTGALASMHEHESVEATFGSDAHQIAAPPPAPPPYAALRPSSMITDLGALPANQSANKSAIAPKRSPQWTPWAFLEHCKTGATGVLSASRLVFLDVGANDGNFSLALIKLCSDYLANLGNIGADVHLKLLLFEPNPVLHEQLAEIQDQAARLEPPWSTTLVTSAVWTTANETKTIWVSNSSTEVSSLEHRNANRAPSGAQSITVGTVDLAAFLLDNLSPGDVAFMKLDIECVEWVVVPHLFDAHALCRLRYIRIEWHFTTRCPGRNVSLFREFRSRLAQECSNERFGLPQQLYDFESDHRRRLYGEAPRRANVNQPF